MKDFLKRIGVIQNTVIRLETDKNEFVKKLKNNVENSDLSWSSSIFEALKTSKHEYKGTVNSNDFKIRKKLTLFNNKHGGMPIIHGKIRQVNTLIYLDVEINGFKKVFVFFLVFMALFYSIGIIGFLITSKSNEAFPLFFIPLLILHGFIMIFLPVFFIRKGIKATKKELEKDFFFMANRNY